MAKKIHISIIFLLLGGFVFAQTEFDKKLQSVYKHTVPQIKPAELKEKIASNQKIILLDTRSLQEREVSHIPGASFIDYNNFKSSDVLQIDKNAEVIVYCTVGARSENIGEKLLEMGFINVKNLYGGILQWANEDGPIVNKNNQPTDSVHTYSWLWSQWLKKGISVH